MLEEDNTTQTDCTIPETIIDYLNDPFGAEPKVLKTLDSVDYVKIVFITVVMVGTLFGNISMIFFVTSLRKSARTTVDIYMVNLAVADLLVCAICMTSFLAEAVQTEHVYILGPVMCKLSSFCQMLFLSASVMTICAISHDRCLAIMSPVYVRTERTIKPVLIIVWLLSIATSLPLLFIKKLFTLRYSNFDQTTCAESWPWTYDKEKEVCVYLEWVPRAYYTFITVSLFFLPVTIMIVANCLLHWRLQLSVPGERDQNNVRIRIMQKKRVITMVFTVLLVFVFCWMPLQLVILYDQYRDKMQQAHLQQWFAEAARAAEFLAFSNSFLNPIVYGVFKKNFREKIRLLLVCQTRQRRFGQPNVLQRVLTFTTSLTTSLRSKTVLQRKESAPACRNNAVAKPYEQIALQECPEEEAAAQEAGKQEKVVDNQAITNGYPAGEVANQEENDTPV